MLKELISKIDSKNIDVRLAALEALRELEWHGKLSGLGKIGPALPNYIHIHTTASYGFGVPGVYSASHMIWAAHEACAREALLIEHESISHIAEASAAVEIVNRNAPHPMRLIFGVEFKAPIGLEDEGSRRFSHQIGEAWGQKEAAWVVGVGVNLNPELAQLVARFQEAKRWKAAHQLDRLSRHLGLSHPPELSTLLTPDGNVTDRSLSFGLAKTKHPQSDGPTLELQAKGIRKMLNPGEPGHVPFPDGLPNYQQVIRKLADMNSVPVFTAQLRGTALEKSLALLKSWGMGGLDVAGIEPDEADAEQQIQYYIEQAKQYDLLILGGADYRGFGTGWLKYSPWMDHPLIFGSLNQLVESAVPVAASVKTMIGRGGTGE